MSDWGNPGSTSFDSSFNSTLNTSNPGGYSHVGHGVGHGISHGGGHGAQPAVSSVTPVNITAMLEISNLPASYQANDVRSTFGRYGSITRIVMDYRPLEDRATCWLDYANESPCCDNALRHDGQKLGPKTMKVQKCVNVVASGNGNDDRARKRTKPEWNNDSAATINGSSWGDNGGGKSDGGWAETTNSWGDSNNNGGESRGRGRGRGGRGGTITCYKCKETGHMTRECPQGGGNKCFNCQEEGHLSRDCPKPRSGGRGGRGGRGRGGGGGGGFSSGGGGSSWGDDNKTNSGADWGSTDWGTGTASDTKANTNWATGGTTDNADPWATAISSKTSTPAAEKPSEIDWGSVLADTKTVPPAPSGGDDDGWG